MKKGLKLLELTKRAQNYVKPFVETDAAVPVITVLSQNHNNQRRPSDHIFDKQKTINAYATSVESHGFAGFVEMDDMPYFKVSWDEFNDELPIKKQSYNNENSAAKNELLSIYTLLRLYANKFKGKNVRIYCDNFSVIQMLKKSNSKNHKIVDSDLQTLVQKTTSICADHNITAHWLRIVGVHQISADRLARDIDDPFQYSKLRPQSQPDPLAFEHMRNIFSAENEDYLCSVE